MSLFPFLPFLQWSAEANQAKLDGRDYELETIQFDVITKLFPQIKADGGTEKRTQ